MPENSMKNDKFSLRFSRKIMYVNVNEAKNI